MNATKNRRRKAPEKVPRPGVPASGRFRTAAVALLLGCLSAVGLWRCLDDGGHSVLEPAPGAESPGAAAPEPAAPGRPEIDLGQGVEPDPTLVNEQALLDSEEPPEAASGAAPEGAEEPAAPRLPEAVDEDRLLAKYPMHAVAFHFHTQVFAEPDRASRVIGYARRGATFRVGERAGNRDCPRGWHEIRGGGYICDGLGFNVGREPLSFSPAPPAPRFDEPLPYDYRHVRSDHTPQYWRIPTIEERAETAAAIAALAAGTKPARKEPEPGPDTAALERVLARAAALAEEGDAGPGDVDAGPSAPPPAPVVAAPSAPPEVAADPVEPGQLPAYVHLRMAKGYYVSVDDTVRSEDGAAFTRTVRSRFVPAEALAPAKPSAFEGVLVDEETPLPLVFVVGSGVSLLARKGQGGPLTQQGTAERYQRFGFLGRERIGGKPYVQVGENLFLAERGVAVAEAASPPSNLQPGERWIAVSLGQQTLVAYEGETPVFATLVATGRKEFPTPTGEFRIYGKHVSITMDDTDAGEESYSIEDVPWTQYFKDGYALHAAFWHDRLGRVRSHGCVNLSPADARRIFLWTGPAVPPGLHGAIATRDNPGTRVVIRD